MEINKLEPPGWFSDMTDDCLDLLIYGSGLSAVTAKSTIPHHELKIVSSSDSYLLLELRLKDACTAGDYEIRLSSGKETKVIPYRIDSRSQIQRRSLLPADVVYLIVADRFSRIGDDSEYIDRSKPFSWHGGNINGIRAHLPYFKELGVTALWITPMFANNRIPEMYNGDEYHTYHGYSITDFYSIDERFGTIDEYMALVEEAHNIGLKIVMDTVFNHCGDEHQWLRECPLKDWVNGFSPETRLYSNKHTVTVFDKYAAESDARATVDGWFTPHMADLNLRNPYVLRYLTQMTKWWIEKTGIDAIRMDTFLYSDLGGMLQWLKELRKEYPTFPVIAETWMNQPEMLATAQRVAIGATGTRHPLIVMDFAFQKALSETFRFKTKPNAMALYDHFAIDFVYPNPTDTLAFIDNHDMDRWAFSHDNPAIVKQALGILLTSPRIPQIYYGTEIMLKGNMKGDGNMRADFPGGWKDDMANKFMNENRDEREQDVFKFISNLLNFRKRSNALTKGEMIHYLPENNVYVYFRIYRNEKIMTAVNFNAKMTTLKLDRFKDVILDKKVNLIDILSDRFVYSKDSASECIKLNKNEILIMKVEPLNSFKLL